MGAIRDGDSGVPSSQSRVFLLKDSVAPFLRMIVLIVLRSTHVYPYPRVGRADVQVSLPKETRPFETSKCNVTRESVRPVRQ